MHEIARLRESTFGRVEDEEEDGKSSQLEQCTLLVRPDSYLQKWLKLAPFSNLLPQETAKHKTLSS
jgi:hypothetical protein